MNPPMAPPKVEDLLRRFANDPPGLLAMIERVRAAGVGTSTEGRYRHWDKLRHLPPPDDLSHEQWWLGTKMAREALYREIPLADVAGRRFVYSMPDEALDLLHYIDQRASGEIAMPEVLVGNETAKRQYLVNAFIEEAIRSSQLEGAATTRRVAKEMIRSGRPPRDRSEQMILNNYRAIEFLHANIGERLTPDLIFRFHRILTEGTLDNPDAAGRLQTVDEERVAVWDRHEDRLLHRPPPADQLEERLTSMCAFANSEIGATGFMHPVIRAILLHFWLAHDHPFEDGNGRTARALFYWSMASQGYWLTEYLSISRILRQAPGRYDRAYLYTETDGGDTTYFFLFHLSIIRQAIEELHRYLRRKVQEIRRVEDLIRQSDRYNYRQLALLGNALRHPEERYTFVKHARSHHVSWQSARTDLLDLRKHGLLGLRRVGRTYVFSPVPDLSDRLADAR